MNRLPIIAASVAALALASCAATQSYSAPSAQERSEADSYGNYLAGRFAASQHDMTDAAKFYQAGLHDDPNNGDLLERAFLYTASAGDIDKASEYAMQVTASQKDSRAARLVLAVQDISRKKYADARAQVAQSAGGPFTSLTISLLDAWAAVGAGDTAAALKDLSDLKSQGGTDALASFHRALIFDLLGRDADAEVAYKEAMQDSGAGPRIIEAYGRFLERAGRADEAKAIYAKLNTGGAPHPVAVEADARIASGKKPEKLVSTPAEGAAEALFGISASLTDATSADVAILYLRLSLHLRPDLDLAKILLADRFEVLEKYQDAIEAYQDIDKDSPYYDVAVIQVAVDENRLDQTDKSIALLKEFTASHPDSIEGWTALGDAYRGSEKFAEAADAYDHAVKQIGSIDKSDWPLFYARGISEERAHRWDAAEQDLKQALKLKPDEPQVLNYLGYSWIDQGRNTSEALAMLEKARALKPLDGYIVDSVGWAYYRTGRYQDSVKALEDAVLLVPGDPTINDHLGDAYWKVGRRLDAQFQWNHALAFNPAPDDKAKIEQKLKNGV
ncbi:MAG TPA: tetratricopeptide repeat protein [Rhizomicrobium sp.]|nr:tetratricopeptide repeat protein [Rhizomicrobium sp.]